MRALRALLQAQGACHVLDAARPAQARLPSWGDHHKPRRARRGGAPTQAARAWVLGSSTTVRVRHGMGAKFSAACVEGVAR